MAPTPPPTYWQATKVMWAFFWRTLVFMGIPVIAASLVIGIVGGLFKVSSGLIGLATFPVSLICIVNFYRIMLNKRNFRSFSFTVNPAQSAKVTWMQAIKVAWSKGWRSLVYCMIPLEIIAILTGYIVGGIMNIYGITPSFVTHAGNVLLGMVIGFAGSIMFYHYLLQKSEFKTFIIKAKP